MRYFKILPLVLLILGTGACEGDPLEIRPVDEIDEDIAIIDGQSAQAALNGAYAALEDGNYYGTDYVIYGDLMADNAQHEGTFDTYSQADRHALVSENVTLDGVWAAIYSGIYRVNILIQEVPTLEGLDPALADGILAQAYALRALHYHNLVRAWGDVPLVLEPMEDLAEAAEITRAPVAQVYTQILDDLQTAEQLFQTAGADNSARIFTTPGFVDGMQARVNLYMENWAAAANEALEVVNSGDYALAPSFNLLFPPDEGSTAEDIFTVVFTEDNFNNYGYYYQFAGRFEVGATPGIFEAFPTGDDRFLWSFGAVDGTQIEVTKFPTTIGAENFPALRYGEVLLTLSEALARQGGGGNLALAVQYLNMVRTRAGVPGYSLGEDLNNDQGQVIDAVLHERRLELAFEGDRWFDLVRTGRAVETLPTLNDSRFTLWPIPRGELDVAPNLTQNPGY